MLDETDLRILEILGEEARIQWKEIGERIHMTGQSVAARIQKMRDMGVIEAFTVRTDPAKLGKPITFYVNVYMKSNNHPAFLQFVDTREEIVEAHRTSGGGCYLLKAQVASNEAMNKLLDEILVHGNYGVSLSIGRVK